jgi:hypothetical protein
MDQPLFFNQNEFFNLFLFFQSKSDRVRVGDINLENKVEKNFGNIFHKLFHQCLYSTVSIFNQTKGGGMIPTKWAG